MQKKDCNRERLLEKAQFWNNKLKDSGKKYLSDGKLLKYTTKELSGLISELKINATKSA